MVNSAKSNPPARVEQFDGSLLGVLRSLAIGRVPILKPPQREPLFCIIQNGYAALSQIKKNGDLPPKLASDLRCQNSSNRNFDARLLSEEFKSLVSKVWLVRLS